MILQINCNVVLLGDFNPLIKKCTKLRNFDKLDEMIIKLHYNYGIFININSLNSFLADYEGTNKDKLQEFCIKQLDGKLKLRYAYIT